MASTGNNSLGDSIKGLTFDVFGTVVDWRSSVISELETFAASKLKDPPSSSSNDATSSPSQAQALAALARLTQTDWARFAQQWRDSYKVFTKSFVPGQTPWKDIDTHHLDSLRDLLREWGLEGAYDERETQHLSLAWHRLTPWADSAEGLRLLGGKYVTSTLSNGNSSLLGDLDAFGGLGFRCITSAEEFRAYKPAPEVYLGAVRKLGADEPAQVAMVASHLSDLKAAREQGMRTIYTERRGEEDWAEESENYQEAKGWVDMWVTVEEGGFVEVARRLGVSRGERSS